MKINRRFITSTAAILVSLLSFLVYSLQGNTQSRSYPMTGEVYFSPRGGAAQAIVRELNNAKKEVKVQAYSFTNKDIAQALVDAKRRGVVVEVILDKSNRSDKYTSADFVAHMNISTYIDAQHQIAHNKIMIIDQETVVTGSFNFSKAAEEKNAENLLVLRSSELARTYLDNWEMHKQHAETYMGR